MTEEINQQLCRVYTIICPACGTQNRFPRLKRDIYRSRKQEPDGHTLELAWMTEGEFPEWLTPLNYFWGTCETCCYTDELDDADYRQWEKNKRKYLAQYREGGLETLSSGAQSGNGVLQALKKGIHPEDPFGTPLAQFFMGIFTQCLRNSPVPGNLARSYLRVAWLYRDETQIYASVAPNSSIRDTLSKAAPMWNAELPENSDYPLPPGIVTDEVGALRHAMALFEWNFRELSAASHEDEIRLMALIGEISYRIYELTGTEEDFKKGQTLFSGCMQKCLSVINDKSIVGGAVNKAKDALEKAGDRGRELRALKQRRDKGLAPKPEPVAAAIPPPPPVANAEPEPEEVEVEKAPEPKPSPTPAFSGSGATMQSLQQKVAQLDEENKRWMRLAGISELTGLPNRIMLSRVLLPGALKQALVRKEPLGCILVAPEGMREINGKYGRIKGDILLRKLSECLKGLLKRGERLAHPDGINFLVIVPTMPLHHLRKRAEILYKDLTSRRFDLDGETLSLKMTFGVAGMDTAGKGDTPKTLQDILYSKVVHALDTAKLKGNQIEVHEDRAIPR
ncbi:MAG: GGDEF domain-containing protein [bacterium]|nr:GGDEF domain-containing protein [bacterium]